MGWEGFKNMFAGSGSSEKPKEEKAPALPRSAKDLELDREARDFMAGLEARGITDKDTKIISVEGQATTEKREGAGKENADKSYMNRSGRQGA